MDLTDSIAPRSDQINADELAAPVTYTIREVVKGKAEQPFDFLLVETDRAYRPAVIMRRLIVAAWGPETSAYAGKRLTLYRDPSVTFGPNRVGGVRISHMSDIPKRVEIMSQVTRGKREKFAADPLPDAPPPNPNAARIAELRDEYRTATDERKAEIRAEVESLQVQP